MRFSIIVPIYNVEPYLPTCIDSLIGQTYREFEVVLVDDGSTDGSAAICDRYAAQDDRIKVIHKPNGGLVSARKAGAEAVCGDYVLNLDGDDWVAPDYLQTVSQAVEDSGGADMLIWSLTEVYEDRRVTAPIKLPQGLYCDRELERLKGLYLYDKEEPGIRLDTVMPGWTKAVRRELYCDCQKAAPDMLSKGEDALVMLRMLTQCSSLYILHYNGYYYRIVASSMMRNISEKDFGAVSALLHAMRELAVPWPAFENQLQVYGLYMLEHLLVSAARAYPYRRYRAMVGECLDEELLAFVSKGVIAVPRKTDRILRWAVTCKRWWLLYVLVKIKG